MLLLLTEESGDLHLLAWTPRKLASGLPRDEFMSREIERQAMAGRDPLVDVYLLCRYTRKRRIDGRGIRGSPHRRR